MSKPRRSDWPVAMRSMAAAWSVICALIGSAAAETVRFVVSETDSVHRDSYILPLSSPSDIAHARDLINMGPDIGRHIAVASIAAGSDGINRDVLADMAPPWSWHTSGFMGFFDTTAEILDGWPTFVESDVDGWIENTEGVIGFWMYTVTAELLAGDYNFDFQVNMNDYSLWRGHFGSTSDLAADGNGNGVVDAADYVIWRQNLPAPGITVPEPATLGFAAFAMLGRSMIRDRRNSSHRGARR